MIEQQKRYFHGGGLAFRVGNDFVMDPIYEGERPKRVVINPDAVEKKSMFESQKENFYTKSDKPEIKERKPRDEYKPADIDLIVQQYKDGASLQTLALKFHRAAPTIRTMLRDAGVPIRSAGRKKNTPWVNLYK